MQPTMRDVTANHPAVDLTSIEASLVEITNIYGERFAKNFDLNTRLTDPPEEVLCLIERFAEQEQAEARLCATAQLERRREERVPCTGSAIAVPVDSHFVQLGEPFIVTIRDISEHGIRLFYTRSVNADYLALRWEAKTSQGKLIRVVARILRCHPKGPIYELAGEFVLAD